MAPAVKKTKKAAESLNAKLALATKSGKYTMGYKSTLKTLRQGKGKFLADTRLLLGDRSPFKMAKVVDYLSGKDRPPL